MRRLKRATPEQVARHDAATRCIIIGTLVRAEYEGWGAVPTGDKIMEILARRGYRPDVAGCNLLRDGTCV